MSITWTQTVLTSDAFDAEGNPRFTVEGPEEGRRAHKLYLDREVWRDMGRPGQVTVTVEPGDKLNEEG